MNYPGLKTVLTIYKDLIELGMVEVETFVEKLPFGEDQMQTKEVVMAITSTEIIND